MTKILFGFVSVVLAFCVVWSYTASALHTDVLDVTPRKVVSTLQHKAPRVTFVPQGE